jgi:putative chitinase
MASNPTPIKAPVPITGDQLKKLFRNADDDLLEKIASELNTDLAKYGLDTPLRKAHFFAQIMQEVGPGFDELVESLNYRPQSLIDTFGYYKAHPAEATQDGAGVDPATNKIVRHANEQVVANKAYANRNGNGDIASGDGFRFRGRGCIQVTFRGNYRALAARYKSVYGEDADFENNPELLASCPHAVRSAVCFWLQNKLQILADQGDSDENVNAITHVVNAKTNSGLLRIANFHKALPVFQGS